MASGAAISIDEAGVEADMLGSLLLCAVLAGAQEETASAHAVGALEVVSTKPGARVDIDGEDRGRTPLRVDGLKPGSHRVRVVSATDGNEALEMDVVVQAGLLVRLDAGPIGSAAAKPVAGPSVPGMAQWLLGNPVVVALASRPWVYVAGTAFALSALAAGILWTSTPGSWPVFGESTVQVSPLAFTIARWSTLVLVCLSAAATLAVLFLPSLPLGATKTPPAAAQAS